VFGNPLPGSMSRVCCLLITRISTLPISCDLPNQAFLAALLIFMTRRAFKDDSSSRERSM